MRHFSTRLSPPLWTRVVPDTPDRPAATEASIGISLVWLAFFVLAVGHSLIAPGPQPLPDARHLARSG